MTEHENDSAQLGSNRRDDLVLAARGLVGAVPFIGSLAAEIIGRVIPEQRLDRFVDVLKRLDARLSAVERDLVADRLNSSAEHRDLFEEGLVQASRAVTDERRERIAALLKSSLTASDLNYSENQRLWSLLQQLTDLEILILQSYGLQAAPDGFDFLKQHGKALAGASHSAQPRKRIDKAAIQQSYRRHLADLGLLAPRFKRWEKGQIPEFDRRTGMPVLQDYSLTRLGGILLRKLELTSHL
jgi:hypothetical protein